MKKKIILTAAICYMALINTPAQESNHANPEKKPYMSLVKIETIAGETIDAAYSRRTPDTVYVSLLEKDYVKAGGKRIKIIKEDAETGFAVDQIRNYNVINDPNIVYRDDLQKRKKQLKSKNAWKIVGISTACIVALPIIAVGTLAAGMAGGF
jgi:hypothetical protein